MVLTNIIAKIVIFLKKFAAVSSSLFTSKVQIPCGFTARLLQVLSFFYSKTIYPVWVRSSCECVSNFCASHFTTVFVGLNESHQVADICRFTLRRNSEFILHRKTSNIFENNCFGFRKQTLTKHLTSSKQHVLFEHMNNTSNIFDHKLTIFAHFGHSKLAT